MTKNNLPVVAGVEINVDEFGRYNLNALHKASGAGDSKKPSAWLRNAQTQELINGIQSGQSVNLHSGYDVINVVNGTANPGTFATELLAIDYAAWISPQFKIQVYKVFQAYKNGTLVQPQIPHDFKSAVQHLLVQIEENERLEEINQTNRILITQCKAVLEDTVPAANAIHAMQDAGNTIALANFGSALGIGRTTFFKHLRSMSILMVYGTKPYQQFIDSGYLVYKLNGLYGSTYITANGMVWLYKKLLQSDIVQDVHAEQIQALIDSLN